MKKYFPRNEATVTGVVEKAEKGEMDWKTCLETIFKMEQFHMDHTIWTLGYGPYDVDHMILSIRYDLTVTLRASSPPTLRAGSLQPRGSILTK